MLGRLTTNPSSTFNIGGNCPMFKNQRSFSTFNEMFVNPKQEMLSADYIVSNPTEANKQTPCPLTMINSCVMNCMKETMFNKCEPSAEPFCNPLAGEGATNLIINQCCHLLTESTKKFDNNKTSRCKSQPLDITTNRMNHIKEPDLINHVDVLDDDDEKEDTLRVSIGTGCKAGIVFSISPPTHCLKRTTSECESEDSFVVFEGATPSEDEYDYTISDCESSESEDEENDDDDDEDGDVVDFVSTVDKTWPTTLNCQKKVRFADDKHLCTVFPMVKWSYAYRTARRGPWEEYARDSNRFSRRIVETENLLRPILDAKHRDKIYANRFSSI